MMTDTELETLCDAFVAANRAEFMDTDFDLPIKRAVESLLIAAQTEALREAADELRHVRDNTERAAAQRDWDGLDRAVFLLIARADRLSEGA